MTLAETAAQQVSGADGAQVAWLSDVGVLREGNEDVVVCEPSIGFYAVIDGVGGEVAGERGAAEAARVLVRRMRRDDGAPADRQMREAIALANNQVLKLAEEDESLRGMSCVLTAALVRGDEVIVGHVGDTRLYLIDERGMLKITADHSPVGQMEDMGELSELEARRHPRRNEIFRDVGSTWRSPEDREFIDVYRFPWTSASALLLCSDGLTDQVATSEILATIDDQEPVAAVTRLVDLANAAGGKDNVSVLLLAGRSFGSAAAAEQHDQPSEKASRVTDAADGSTTRRRGGTSEHPALRGNELARRGRQHDPTADPLRRAGAVRGKGVRRVALTLIALLTAGAGWWWFGAPGLPAPARRQVEALSRSVGLGPSWTLTVGADGSSHARIQEAIDAALPGDTVLVEAGLYFERLTLRSDLVIRASTPRSAVLVAGNSNTVDETPAILGRDVRDVVLEGLLIVGADRVDLVTPAAAETADSGASAVDGAAPLNVGVRLIRSAVTLRDLEVVGVAGTGIELLGSDQSVLEQSFFRDQAGVCVRLGSDSASQLAENLFVRCGGGAQAAPALDLRSARSPRVRGNQFRESEIAVWTGSEQRLEEIQLRNSFDGEPSELVLTGPAPEDEVMVETTAGAASPTVGGGG